ncbi:MAG: hypothetical protein MUO36_04385 [Candidatus Hadarchaeum sp.]|nr:hypothetical protein [Candidatus Hadarchaeum sp.]
MEYRKRICALCLMALAINFLMYLLFLYATWDKNNLIFMFSLGFLIINLFCVIPLGFPLYFPFAITKSIKRGLTKNISSLKNLVLITKTAQFLYTILLLAMWAFSITVFSIAVTRIIFGYPYMMDRLVYPMAFSLGGTVLLLLHTAPFSSLMGYPTLRRFWPSSRQSFFEEINEARMFLLFSRSLIKKKYKEGITLLAHSLLILNSALSRKERWTTQRGIEGLYPTLEMLEAIETIDYGKRKKSTITDFQEKILTLIDEERLLELPTVLSNFVNKKELEPFKKFPVRPKITIGDRLGSILKRLGPILKIIPASLVSLISPFILKNLEFAVQKYSQLLCFVVIISAFYILSYLLALKKPATFYPLPINVISALSKRS